MHCTITLVLYPVAAVDTSVFVCIVHIYEIIEPGAVQVFLSSLSNNSINLFYCLFKRKMGNLKYIVNIKQVKRRKGVNEGAVFSG